MPASTNTRHEMPAHNPGARDDDMVAFGRYQLFPHLRLLLRDGVRLDVGERALDVLAQLVQTPGQLVSKDALLSRIWPQGVIEENSLQAQISSLRRVLGEDRGLIATEFGRGYRFTGSVQSHRAATSSLGEHQARVDLPRPRSPLIGRVDELLALNRLLATQTLCTLIGPAGIGKTRLAIEAASEASAGFPDGVYFVDLSQVGSAASVSPAISGALAGLLGTGTQLASHPEKALLVVDNCEHLASACAAIIERLLQRDPRLTVLLTSQTRLGLDGEQAYRLRPLALPAQSINAQDARDYSAVELFVRRVISADYHFELTEENVDQVTTLCRALDGVPLALEIAAARVPSLGLAAVTEDLAHSAALLSAQKHRSAGRHRTLGDALAWSYQLLEPVEQAVFQELAIFPGDFTLAAAEDIVCTRLEGSPRLVDVLSSLVEKSLIILQTGTQPVRYRYLAMLRAYALEQLADRAAAMAEKHARHVEQLVAQARRDWIALPTTQWRRQYEHNIDDIRSALAWSFADSRRGRGLRILADSEPFWIQLSLHDECRQRITNVLDDSAAPFIEAHQEMMLQAALATSLTWARGPVPATGQAWTRAADLALQLDDIETQLQAHYGLWLFYLRSGRYAQALEQGENMAAVALRHRDHAALLTARRLTGTARHFLGNHTEALAEIESMLDGYARNERHGSHFRFGLDQRVAGWTFLARILWLTGNTTKASRAAQIAVDEAMALDHACTLCCALSEGSCTVAALSGDVEEVARVAAQLKQLAGDHGLAFWGLYGSAFALWARVFRDPHAVSAMELRSALQTLQARGFDPAYSVFLSDYASAMIEQGDAREAARLIDTRLAADATAGHLWNAAELLRIKSRTLADEPAPPAQKSAILRRAMALARAQKAKAWESRLAAE